MIANVLFRIAPNRKQHKYLSIGEVSLRTQIVIDLYRILDNKNKCVIDKYKKIYESKNNHAE